MFLFQVQLQKDPQTQVREALQEIFRNNSGREEKDGLFKGIDWKAAVFINYPIVTNAQSIVGFIVPADKVEIIKKSVYWTGEKDGRKVAEGVRDQFIAALEGIGLTVTDHEWMKTNTGKDYYGFYVKKTVSDK